MALYLFVFAALCGILTALISVMLFPIGITGGIAVFFATCYGVALTPLAIDLLTQPKEE